MNVTGRPGRPRRDASARSFVPGRLAAALAILLAAVAGPGAGPAQAQERTIALVFTAELSRQIAVDNQGERTEEIQRRILGLSPDVTAVRLSRSGGRVSLTVTARALDGPPTVFRFVVDKMAYYRLGTARDDVGGMTAALQEARREEPLIRAVAYRADERYAIVEVTLESHAASAAGERRAEAPPSSPPAPTLLAARPLGGEAPPQVDGSADDAAWSAAEPFPLEVEGASGNLTVTLSALWDTERVWILAQWPDGDLSDQHRPWVWSAAEKAYVEGSELEDALALAFAREGRIGECMLSGTEAALDLWAWRAGRGGRAGFAEDATLVVSQGRIAGARSYEARNGLTVWVQEVADEGTPPYRRQEAGAFAGARVPRYEPRTPWGSAADVTARGSWKDGAWTLELSRRLATGDPADVVLAPGRDAWFSVAVFDHRAGAGHSASREIALRLEER